MLLSLCLSLPHTLPHPRWLDFGLRSKGLGYVLPDLGIGD